MTAQPPALFTGWRCWVGFIAMSLGMFMAVLDIQIVATSLIDIQAALGLEMAQLSWLQTAYLIAEIVAIPLTGWLIRSLSTRVLFLGAVAGFTLASIACAASTTFPELITARIVQGFCGGAIIPAVFSSGFQMFPERLQPRAMVVAGVFAMLAPTIGPSLGGFITEISSWHWLFLINVVPGMVVMAVVGWLVAIDRGDRSLLRRIDVASLGLLALALASLELWLKKAPELGWDALSMMLLGTVSVGSGCAAIYRSLRVAQPVTDFRLFRDRCFTIGCWYSFALGVAIYGSTYMLPLFLGLVRHKGPLEIGEIMIVTGAAQVLVAPLAPWLERRFDPRIITGIGYALFAAGLLLNGYSTFRSDYEALFWPQVLRGGATMLCLIPSTTLALGRMPLADVPNASSLFNMMRNLGGAIGLAVIDTILMQRTPHHIDFIVARLQAGDPEMARLVGLPVERFHNLPLGPVDEATRQLVEPLVRRAGLVWSFNDAWLLIGTMVGLSLVALPLMRRPLRDMTDKVGIYE